MILRHPDSYGGKFLQFTSDSHVLNIKDLHIAYKISLIDNDYEESFYEF